MSDQSHGGHEAEESALDKIGPYLVWAFLTVVLIVSVLVMTGSGGSSGNHASPTSAHESSAATPH
jgi:hypothetical protein